MSTEIPRLNRRSLLATATATAAIGSAGCLQEARSILNMGRDDRINLSIATVPADDDWPLVTIANRLRDNLEAIGVETSLDLLELSEFRLQVLFNRNFDIAIVRHPGHDDPDFLYSLLHSRFAPERGWQNPYGLTDHEIDSHLEHQRTASITDRVDVIGDLLELIALHQPFSPICFTDEQVVIATDRFDPPPSQPPITSTDLLALQRDDSTDDLVAAIRETSATTNLNPLSIEYRNRGLISGLLYDPLIRRFDGDAYLWLATAIEWDGHRVTVDIRDADWHDGEPITATDVAFTYRFLDDTSAPESDARAPVPHFRSRSSLVETVDVVDETTVEFELVTDQTFATRAFTVPILPERHWSDRSEPASAGPFSGDDTITDALVTDNMPPVGGGPYRYASSDPREYVEFELVEEHFSQSVDSLSRLRPSAQRITVDVIPNEGAAMDGLTEGSMHLSIAPLYDAIRDGLPPELSVVDGPGTSLVQVAYNLDRSPLSNQNFRQIISRLIDKQDLVEDHFDGNARATAVPLADTSWVPDHLQWDGTDPVAPFFGEGGDLDEEAARAAVVEAGFSYDDDGYIIDVQ